MRRKTKRSYSHDCLAHIVVTSNEVRHDDWAAFPEASPVSGYEDDGQDLSAIDII